LNQCRRLAEEHKFGTNPERREAAETAVKQFLDLLQEVESRFVKELGA
jgi:hypothetical protein